MKRGLYETDEAVIAGIRCGDDRALAHMYKLHFPMVSHLILSNNGTDDEAKDIYQEGVIVFYEKIKDNSLELSCQIKTYLYSVCRRLWLKKLAEKGRFAVKLDDAENYLMLEEDVPQHEENERQFGQMEVAMNQLGEPCRSLLEDYYIRTQ